MEEESQLVISYNDLDHCNLAPKYLIIDSHFLG